jgi:ABC-type sugar transport system substrate-binding protein
VKFERHTKVLRLPKFTNPFFVGLRTGFEKFGSAHSVVIYSDPSSELLENAKASGLDIKIFSFLQGL